MKIETNSFGDTFYSDDEGRLHREGGPAVISAQGTEGWFEHGCRHRLDGPARIWKSGALGWFVHDQNITNEVDDCIETMGIEPDFTKWTGKEKTWFKLFFEDRFVLEWKDFAEWMDQILIEPDYTKWTDKEKVWLKLRFGIDYE